jgi:galactokinase
MTEDDGQHIMRATSAELAPPPGGAPADPDLISSVRRRAAFLWGAPPDVITVTPGRIEIVGNHVDYNGGDVVAAAIDRWMVVAAHLRPDEHMTLAAADIPRGFLTVPMAEARTFDRRRGGERAWSDYGLAVAAALNAAGHPTRGADLFYRGTVPPGVGLSSSSALLVATAAALAALTDCRLDLGALTFIAEDAEHRVGAPVGRLDHTASAIGGVLRFAFDPERVRRLDARLGDAVFAVCDSGVRHGIPSSRYPVRVQECATALTVLQAAGFAITTLAELPNAELEQAVALLPAPLDARVRHVVEEVTRARLAEAALEAGDLTALGELMNASGHSSATLFDISHPAVEAIAAAARSVPGVYGARMMGGGDGGSALALLAREAIEPLIDRVGAHAVTVFRIARGLTVITD